MSLGIQTHKPSNGPSAKGAGRPYYDSALFVFEDLSWESLTTSKPRGHMREFEYYDHRGGQSSMAGELYLCLKFL